MVNVLLLTNQLWITWNCVKIYWWTAPIKPRLPFPHAGCAFWVLPFSQFNWTSLHSVAMLTTTKCTFVPKNTKGKAYKLFTTGKRFSKFWNTTHTPKAPSLAYYLFLCVFVGWEQVDRLHVAKVDVVAEEEDEEQLTHILLLLVAVQRLVTCTHSNW